MATISSNFDVFVRNRGNVNSQRWSASNTDIVCSQPPHAKKYAFSRVFGPENTQQDVFDNCAEPLVLEFLRGLNATIFVYGHTGTGKTYTMTGDCRVLPKQPSEFSYPNTSDLSYLGNPAADLSPDAGIVPRVLESICRHLAQQSSQDWVLEMTFVELYNEKLQDLFGPDNIMRNNGDRRGYSAPDAGTRAHTSSNSLRIVERDRRNGPSVIEVQGARPVFFRSVHEAMEHVEHALEKRATAQTLLNEASSRSHTILTVKLTNKLHEDDTVSVCSKINLVDLAGSENVKMSGATDKRAKEAGNINRSLCALTNVIEALVAAEDRSNRAATRAKDSQPPLLGTNLRTNIPVKDVRSATPRRPHIPYRDSKLTHLLRDSLGGTTKTVMIATVDLSTVVTDASIRTLEYAVRAKSIHNLPQTEMEISELPATLAEYRSQFIEVQKMLAAQQNREGVYITKTQYDAMRSKLHAFEQIEATLKTCQSERELARMALANAAHTEKSQKLEIARLQRQLAAAEQEKANSQMHHRNFVEISRKVDDVTGHVTHLVQSLAAQQDICANLLTDVPEKIDQFSLELVNQAMRSSFTPEIMKKLSTGLNNHIQENLGELASELETHLRSLITASCEQVFATLDQDLVQPLQQHLSEIIGSSESVGQACQSVAQDIRQWADNAKRCDDITYNLRQRNEKVMELLSQVMGLHNEQCRTLNDLRDTQQASDYDHQKSRADELESLTKSAASSISQTKSMKEYLQTIEKSIIPASLDMSKVDQVFTATTKKLRTNITQSLQSTTEKYEEHTLLTQQARAQDSRNSLLQIGDSVLDASKQAQQAHQKVQQLSAETQEKLALLKSLKDVEGDDSGSHPSSGSAVVKYSQESPSKCFSPTRKITTSPVRLRVASPLKHRGKILETRNLSKDTRAPPNDLISSSQNPQLHKTTGLPAKISTTNTAGPGNFQWRPIPVAKLPLLPSNRIITASDSQSHKPGLQSTTHVENFRSVPSLRPPVARSGTPVALSSKPTNWNQAQPYLLSSACRPVSAKRYCDIEQGMVRGASVPKRTKGNE